MQMYCRTGIHSRFEAVNIYAIVLVNIIMIAKSIEVSTSFCKEADLHTYR
jgi:hypothetical protein